MGIAVRTLFRILTSLGGGALVLCALSACPCAVAAAGATLELSTASEGLPGDTAYAIVAARDGALWVASSGGLATKAPGSRTWTPFRAGQEMPDLRPRRLALHPDGRLFAAGTEGPLVTYHHGRFTTLARPAPVAEGALTLLAVDEAGHVWLGNDKGHLATFSLTSPQEGSVLRLHERLEPARAGCAGIATSFFASQGRNYVTIQSRSRTGGGVLRVAGPEVNCLSGPGLRTDSLTGLWVSPRGTVWVTQSKSLGVSRLRGDEIHNFNESDGLRCDQMLHVFGQADTLWLACAVGITGLSEARADAYLAGQTEHLSASYVNLVKGATWRELSEEGAPVTAWAEDRLWLATRAGVVALRPPVLDEAAPYPEARLDRLDVEGQPLELSAETAIRGSWLNVGFDVGLPPEASTFRYRLAGHEATWRVSARDSSARFANVRPGRYRFEVSTTNATGAWGPTQVLTTLEVAPPFHQTNSFRLLLVAATLAAGGGFQMVRTARRKARARALAEERQRIARELHDGLGQGFAAMNLCLETLEETLQGAAARDDTRPPLSRALAVLEKTKNILKQARDSTRRSVWNLRADAQGDKRLDVRLRELATNTERAPRAPRVELVMNAALGPRDAFVENELAQVAGEAVANALRHAQARTLTLTLSEAEAGLELLIEDDGRGLPPALETRLGHGHFGILGMRERCRVLGGELQVAPRFPHGTRVRAWVPHAKTRG